MHSDAVEAQLRSFLVDEMGLPPAIGDDDRLADRGFLASIQLLDLVGFVEDRFAVRVGSIDVTPEELSIARLAALVRARRGR